MAERAGKKALKKLPPLTLGLIVVSVVLIGTVVLFILFPQSREIERIRQERVTAGINLGKQQKLFPLFAQAKAIADMRFEPKIPLVERAALGRDKISTLSELFTMIGQKSNMNLSSNSLDINSLKNGSDSVSMELVFTGDLFDYRNCLISLVSLPFFSAVETIQISTDKEQVKKFLTKILIKIDKK